MSYFLISLGLTISDMAMNTLLAYFVSAWYYMSDLPPQYRINRDETTDERRISMKAEISETFINNLCCTKIVIRFNTTIIYSTFHDVIDGVFGL